MKRVGCLYRVSTKMQLENINDIPLQRNSCKNFIDEREDWVLTKEYFERGVSGYRKSANNRDAVQDIKADVINNEIDILLVFLFDRIGRRENETPFVVSWLIKHDIEVWSVNEGRRELNKHSDKLINYMTYWQAEGESRKTGIRVKERQIQLIKEGIFLGTVAPYGYKLVQSETLLTKLGTRRKVLEIIPEQAEVVKLIYNLIVYSNYGMRRIARYLNEKGIRNANGRMWVKYSVHDVVKRQLYKGYYTWCKKEKVNGVSTTKEDFIISEVRDESIAIVEEELWNKAISILSSKRSIKVNKHQFLLNGLLKCGHCGGTICISLTERLTKTMGIRKYVYCKCRNRDKGLNVCDIKQHKYETIENIVLSAVEEYLISLDSKKTSNKNIEKQKIKLLNEKEKEISALNIKIKDLEINLKECSSNIIVLLKTDDSIEKMELVKEINKIKDTIEGLKVEKLLVEKEKIDIIAKFNDIKKNPMITVNEFNESSFDIRQEIIRKLIREIVLYSEKMIIFFNNSKEGVYSL